MNFRLTAFSLLLLFIPATYLYSQTSCSNCNPNLSLNNGLVACYPFSGNANDESGNNNHGTVNGATLTTDRFGNANSAYLFNGTSSKITVPYSSSLKTSLITLTAWVNYGDNSWTQIITKRNWTNANNEQYAFDTKGFNIKRNGYCGGPAVGWQTLSYGSLPSVGSWALMCVVYDGTNMIYYLNGSQVSSSSFGSYQIMDTCSGAEVIFGATWASAPAYFSGKIDDIRIYNRALSASEILDIYNLTNDTFSVKTGTDNSLCQGDSIRLNANAIGGTSYSWNPSSGLSNPNTANPYAKPATTTQYIVTASNGTCTAKDTVVITVNNCTTSCNICDTSITLNSGLVACYPFNVNTNDMTGNGNDGIPTSLTYTNDRFNISNKSGSFNGTSTKVDLPTTSLQLNTYTYSVWVKASSLPPSGNLFSILSIGYIESDQFLMLSNIAGQTGFGYGSYFTNYTTPDRYWSGTLPTSNTWYHVALTRSASTLKFYVNGSLLDSRSTSGSAAYGSSGIMALIGARAGSTPIQYFNGSIDDLRIYNRDLSSTEILNIYNLNNNAFSVIAGADNNICLTDSVQLNATTPGAVSYSWSPPTGLSNPNIANPYAKPTTTTQYIVTANNGTCTAKDTVQVSVTSINANITTQDTSVCSGDVVKLKTQIDGTGFTWSPITYLDNSLLPEPTSTPSASIKYILTVTKGTCTRKDSIQVTLTTLSQTSAGSDQDICKGDSVQLQASPGTNFVWSPSSGLSDSTIYNPKASPITTTSYIVKASTGSCYAFDTVVVNVNAKPIVDAGPDLFTCQNDSIIILANATGANSYQWSPSVYLSDATILQPKAKPIGNTKFSLKATNTTTGCFNFDTLTITISKPAAAFTADPLQGSLPLNVHFTNLSSGRIASYIWDFGDTSAYSSSKNPSHTFNSESVYYTLLTVTDSSGCIDTAGISIHVLNELMVFIPNVFTPNGDAINEEFEVSYTKGLIKNMRGSIWNRWGSQVYEFEMPGGKWWDGKVEGVYASNAAYVYIVEVTTLKGKVLKFHGTVTLLR